MASDALLPPFTASPSRAIDFATSAAQDPRQLPAAGQEFLRASNGVWLTGPIPPRYVRPLDHPPD
jgi:hypothetical protein